VHDADDIEECDEPDPFVALRPAFQAPDDTWREQAECRKIPLSPRERIRLFFPERGNRSHKIAKEACARCPVSRQCDEYANLTNTEYGIWGGDMRRRTKVAVVDGTEDSFS
jgi:hypothetical protein